jgi:hypothetical protein
LPLLAVRAAFAGGVFIVVSDKKSEDCLRGKDDPERTEYLLASDEAIAALDKYFREEPNPRLYDAAIVNAGLRFCGLPERKAVFKAMVKALDRDKPSKRVFEVLGNYAKSDVLLDEVRAQRARKDNAPDFSDNLRRAEKLILRRRAAAK